MIDNKKTNNSNNYLKIAGIGCGIGCGVFIILLVIASLFLGQKISGLWKEVTGEIIEYTTVDFTKQLDQTSVISQSDKEKMKAKLNSLVEAHKAGTISTIKVTEIMSELTDTFSVLLELETVKNQRIPEYYKDKKQRQEAQRMIERLQRAFIEKKIDRSEILILLGKITHEQLEALLGKIQENLTKVTVPDLPYTVDYPKLFNDIIE